MAAPIPGEPGQGGGHGGGKGTRGSRAFDSPSYLGLGRSEAAAPRGPAGGGRWRCGARWRPRLGGNDEGNEGILVPFSPWAGMEREGAPTVAGGRQPELCVAAALGAWGGG